MPKNTQKQQDEIMKARGESWREDGIFRELCTYHGVGDALSDPSSSGFSLVGAGGREIIEDEYEGGEQDDFHNEEAVLFSIQELDSGKGITVSLTPESARLLAERLNQWADDAEGAADDQDVEKKIEEQRRQYYRNNGI